VLGQVLEGGDRHLRGPLPTSGFQCFAVVLVAFLRRAEVTQHPAGEVHRAPSEPWHLTPPDFRGVLGERVQRERRVTRDRVGVAEEQQGVQGRRGVLRPDLPAGGGPQQRECLIGTALMSPQHPQPGGCRHPVGAVGQ
jgi:hypothetical protein